MKKATNPQFANFSSRLIHDLKKPVGNAFMLASSLRESGDIEPSLPGLTHFLRDLLKRSQKTISETLTGLPEHEIRILSAFLQVAKEANSEVESFLADLDEVSSLSRKYFSRKHSLFQHLTEKIKKEAASITFTRTVPFEEKGESGKAK